MKGKLEENLLLSQFLSRINFYRFLVNNVEVNSTQDYALMTLAVSSISAPAPGTHAGCGTEYLLGAVISQQYRNERSTAQCIYQG